LNWLVLGWYWAASLPLRYRWLLQIEKLQINWVLLSCFAAAALPLLASNRLAVIELAAIGLRRCRCATAGCFKSISYNWGALLPLRYRFWCFK
jgi:hypothetical protein